MKNKPLSGLLLNFISPLTILRISLQVAFIYLMRTIQWPPLLIIHSFKTLVSRPLSAFVGRMAWAMLTFSFRITQILRHIFFTLSDPLT